MNKLYLVMLSVVMGCANMSADRVDDGTLKIPLSGHEYTIEFTDASGNACAALSLYPFDPKLVKATLTPRNNVYDLRSFQRAQHDQFLKSLPFFTRHGAKLGIAAGATAVGSALLLYGFTDYFTDCCRW